MCDKSLTGLTNEQLRATANLKVYEESQLHWMDEKMQVILELSKDEANDHPMQTEELQQKRHAIDAVLDSLERSKAIALAILNKG